MAGFQPVEDEDETVVPHPAAPRAVEREKAEREASLVAQMMAVLTKELSKKALVAISNCFTALSLGTAFWLWLSVLPDPSQNQLAGLAGYAVFVLLLEYVRRR